MPYYNIAKDFRKYYNAAVGIKSMLESPIFGPDYYGGGEANWDDRVDPHDPYYVEDGRFANFPLRQNRTGLCDESAGIFDDSKYIPFCKKIMEDSNQSIGWADNDPENSGIWMREPRSLSSYEYVSARRWYVYDTAGDTSLPPYVPTHELIALIQTQKNVVDQFAAIGNEYVHPYAHVAFSGMWGGGIDNSTKTSKNAQYNPDTSIIDLLGNLGMVRVFTWLDEIYTRNSGCYTCSKSGCELDMTITMAKGCYGAPNFTSPYIDKPMWSDYALRGNFWYKNLERLNVGSWTKYVLYGFGAHHCNSGTFARHAWANQDPLFYAHHAFTFLVNDLAMKSLEQRGLESAPFYGLERDLTVPECPGNNLNDTTIFRNLVRYKTDQEINTEHTWAHIMEMWSPDRRDFEWIINDDYMTNFNETLKYDESCVEYCKDNANLIGDGFPPNFSESEICNAVMNKIQQEYSKTKEEACKTPYNELDGFPSWLTDTYTGYSYSCRLTCGYCSPVCGQN